MIVAYRFDCSVDQAYGALSVSLVRRPKLSELLQDACADHGQSIYDVRSPLRLKELCAARHDFFHRARQTGRWSLKQIAQAAGRTDHTTVIHGIKTHQKRMEASQ